MSKCVIRLGWGEYVAIGEYLPDSVVRDGKAVEQGQATKFTEETLPNELQLV